MNPATTTAQTDAGRPADDAAYYRRVLHGLIEAGADLAGLIHQQAKAAAEAAPLEPVSPEAAVAFDRAARSVRRCILLARKLDEPVSAGQQRRAARRRIIRAVEDAIQFDGKASERESLRAEFLERLDAPDVEDDIANRPVAEIIADICRDLGLAAIPGPQPWKRRTPDDVAELYERAAMLPGWHDSAPGPSLGGSTLTPPSCKGRGQRDGASASAARWYESGG